MKIFEKVNIGQTNKVAANCIALAPLTNTQSNEDGTISDNEYNWLVRRAEGGYGIIITCATHVSEAGKGWDGEMGVWGDKHIPGLTRLAEGIHKNSSLAIAQIFHGGSRAPEKITGKTPWSSSAYLIPGNPPKQVREGIVEDILQVIIDFSNAAKRVYKAGFDGIELHGAHGYLFHQFLSTDTNHRNDEWGGTYENRFRLLQTVIKNIRKELPKDFIVGVRVSPEDRGVFKGIDFDEGLKTAKLLADEGADYIHISAWEAMKRPEKYKEQDKTMIKYYREALPAHVSIMVAGEIWTPDDVEKCINEGADLVALGRCAIGNPDWPKLAVKENYAPKRPPYTVAELEERAISPKFVEYLNRWENFVK
jgi:2,4-dienoyl-CoA reductase-like NADH-dependent reductase (Old Yellow Enzyme family)